MIQKLIAVCLASILVGMASPLFAGELVDLKFVPNDPGAYSRTGWLHTGIAFAPPQTAPQQQPSQPANQPKHLTTTGKILKWVGVGLMGEGALTVGLGAAVGAAGECGGTYQVSCGTAKGVYYGIGGASIGVGLVLFLVGIHKKQ